MMATETSKKKLKAFQFVHGGPNRHLGTSDHEKENQTPPMEPQLTMPVTEIVAEQSCMTEQSAADVTRNNAEFPLTPTAQVKLSLNHLLADKASDDLRASNSPLTQAIGWKQPTPQKMKATPNKSSERPRKRARSSSPPGSSETQRYKYKTPRHNPAAEVWSKFRGDAGVSENVTRVTQDGLECLLLTSSPRSSETTGSVGGLRRYSSCGYQFPKSLKRKKMVLPTGSIQNAVQAFEPNENARPRTSKVSELLFAVGQIQDSKPSCSTGRQTQTMQTSSAAAVIDAGPQSPSLEHGPSDPHPTCAAQDIEQRKIYQPAALSEPKLQGETNHVHISDHEFSDLDIDDDDIEVFSLDKTLPNSRKSPHACARVLSQQSPAKPLGKSQMSIVAREADAIRVPEEDFAADDVSDVDWDQLAASLAIPNRVETCRQEHNPPVSRARERTASTQSYHSGDARVMSEADAGPLKTRLRASCPSHDVVIKRYKIKQVTLGQYRDERGDEQPEKVIIVEEEQLEKQFTVILRQSWYETQCMTNSYVHVFGTFDDSNQCVVDDHMNMIILHPDHLVSATVVADAFSCIRRAVLQDRVKATGSTSNAMLYGNILHELCQSALQSNAWDLASLKNQLASILPQHFDAIVELNSSLEEVETHLYPRMTEMSAWAATFVRETPARNAVVASNLYGDAQVSISKLLAVEEHVWSPHYGLKGNIDATIQISLMQDGSTRNLTVPLEIKTGMRTSEAHRAQTALYTLLISDRYDIDATTGILYYVESSTTMRINAVRHELIHMIMKRNELANYIKDRESLPPMLEKGRQRLCNGCYARTTCHLYHKLSENGNGTSLQRSEDFGRLVKPLNDAHTSFFKKWDLLITKEEGEMMKFRRELWTMPSASREEIHRCFSNVIIAPQTTKDLDSTTTKINRYQYTFVKESMPAHFSFTDSQLTAGEPVVVSDEAGHFALAIGYVLSVRKESITVVVDRKLLNARRKKTNFCARDNQVFRGITDSTSSPLHQQPSSMAKEPLKYRLDKDEFSNGMATVRNNLLQIMDSTIFKSTDLRSLIIEGRPPVFEPMTDDRHTLSQVLGHQINADQISAVQKVMAARDYALVLGMPGTGKTTTVAHIINSLVEKGKTVLLASYTHTAVDNILLKIKQSNISILRLGALAKIHPDVCKFAVLATQQRNTLREVHDAWHQSPVVATTCLGINHQVFTQRTFDYCIVDEASQITLPVCLGPIRMAKKFVLVGDHHQLPPIVQNREALEGGLDMSLFRLLCERHPEALVTLEHQYRMCAPIMSLANTLIYSDRLKCGSETVAKRTLSLPYHAEALRKAHIVVSLSPCHTTSHSSMCQSATCCLSTVLQPQRQVIFLDTDGLGGAAEETCQGSRIVNMAEVALTKLVTTLLLEAGLPDDELGIVTFYRSQLGVLRRSLAHLKSLELHTADKFQGRDKEAVVVSFVRNNATGNVGELLQDWRRINVAITRARSKLLLIGSAQTLSAGPEVLRELINLCRRNGWVVNIPHDTLDTHDVGLLNQSTGPVIEGVPQRNQATDDWMHDVYKAGMTRHRQRHVTVSSRNPDKPLQNDTLKVPSKQGHTSIRIRAKSPIMRDIINEITK